MGRHGLLAVVVLSALSLCVGAPADPTGMYVASGGNLCVIDDHPTVALRHEPSASVTENSTTLRISRPDESW
jgi:hypothetical protein